jgi:hypothetical protein
MAIDNQRADVSAILCGLEATYGVDPTLSPATHGVLINKGAEITPNADKEARNVIRTTHSPAGSIIGAKSLDLSLQVEARGGGMAPDGITPLPPDYDPLLQCCGMQRRNAVRLAVPAGGAWQAGETVTGATSTASGVIEYIERDGLLVVVLAEGSEDFAIESITGGTSNVTAAASAATKALLYQPITAQVSAQKSVASYFWRDAILHKALGAIGTWSLDAQVGKIATFDFKLSALWSDPVDSELPAPTLTELVGIQALGMGVKIGDYTPVCTALKLDLGAKVEKRNDINAAEGLVGMLITGREPSGSLDPEVDKLAKYNPWELWKSGTKSRINGFLGNTPGNRMAFHLGACQRSDLKYGNRVGLATYAESYTPCQVRTGDDELYLCFF